MQSISRARQSGFTLVEIAIVLVIIGLLLGGVLKGQEMIENSKAKAIVNDMKAIQAAYNSYIDRYKAIPGDETNAAMNARGWAGGGQGGNGSGALDIPVADTFVSVAGGEQAAFWRALRASGLVTGNAANVAGAVNLPRNAAGGLIGVTSNTVGGVPGTVYGRSGLFVCASGLSTKLASAIDVLVDGALPANQIGNNIGEMRGANGGANPLAPAAAAPGAVAYNETAQTNPWTLCMRIS